MGQKAEYKSAARSRRLLREAYVQLMAEKPPERITVTDIVGRAGLNRGTNVGDGNPFRPHQALTRYS